MTENPGHILNTLITKKYVKEMQLLLKMKAGKALPLKIPSA